MVLPGDVQEDVVPWPRCFRFTRGVWTTTGGREDIGRARAGTWRRGRRGRGMWMGMGIVVLHHVHVHVHVAVAVRGR